MTSIHTSYFELWDQFMRDLIITPADSSLTKIERVYIAIMAVSARNVRVSIIGIRQSVYRNRVTDRFFNPINLLTVL